MRSGPALVNSLAKLFIQLFCLIIVELAVEVTGIGASLPEFEISDSFLLNEGAKNFITIHKLRNGNSTAQTAALYSIGEP